MVGTRVHHKCYLQTLACDNYAYKPDFLEMVDNAVIQEVVAVQNECIDKGTCKLRRDVAVDMYERVFCRDQHEAGCPDAILFEDFTANMMG